MTLQCKVHSLSCDAGLRKVTDNMKTHKNPELRASSVVKASSKPATSSAPNAATPAMKKPPVCELQGKKWVVVSVLSLGLAQLQGEKWNTKGVVGFTAC